MFWTMFAASALATILFSGKEEKQKDYSSDFRTVNDKLDKIDSKIDSVIDTQKFMRARSCLENFSPLLLEGIKFSYKYHTVQDIMIAAKEGFDNLCAVACADENNFKEARKIFSETYGNETWVTTKFKNEIDEWIKKVEEREKEYNQLKPIYDEINLKVNDIFQTIVYKTPMKKILFKSVVDKKKLMDLIIECLTIIKTAPEISNEYKKYMNENTDKWISVDLIDGYDLIIRKKWDHIIYEQWNTFRRLKYVCVGGIKYSSILDYFNHNGYNYTAEELAKSENEFKFRICFITGFLIRHYWLALTTDSEINQTNFMVKDIFDNLLLTLKNK